MERNDSYYTQDSGEAASIEFCDNIAMNNADHATDCAIVDFNTTEENDNDSLSDCSTDFDKKVNSKLDEEAKKIHNLLPQMNYQNIFATLLKNSTAENRVLLTVWDLLPYKRPNVQLRYIKEVVDNNTVKNDGTIFQIQNVVKDLKTLADNNLENNSINPFDIELPSSMEEAVFQHKTAPQIQSKKLQPAKLKLNKNSSAITYPLSRCTEEDDGNESKNRTLLSGKNIFEENSTNNFTQCMNKYMKYLQFVKNAKYTNWKKFNFPGKYVIRQSYLHPKDTRPYKETSQFIKEVPNIVNIPTLKFNSYLQGSNDYMSYSSSFEELNKVENLEKFVQDKHLDKQEQFQTEIVVLAESSTTTKTFEGVRRKECIQKKNVLTSEDEQMLHHLESRFCYGKSGDSVEKLENIKRNHIIEKIDQCPDIKNNERIHKGHHEHCKLSFDIKMFLKVFPNPFQYFENPNRKCKFNYNAFEFLKFKFSYINNINMLKVYYKRYKYNLTLSAQALETLHCRMDELNNLEDNSSIVNYAFIANNDIPLLQECEFITHKEKIRNYMNRVKDDKIKEFEKLKRNDKLCQCEYCFDVEYTSSQFLTCNCGHVFCKSCIKTKIEIRLKEDEGSINCLLTCDEEFDLFSLKEVLSPTYFRLLLNKKRVDEALLDY